MAEVHDSEPTVTETEDAAHDLQSKIKGAMRSRVAHFKKQADSLTFEGVRRLLEKDLEMETYALDVHKRFIKQCLLECLEGAGNGNASMNAGETLENDVCSTRGESELPEEPSPKKALEEPSSEDEGQKEDSPVLGLMTGLKTTIAETDETGGSKNNEVLSVSTIKKAIRNRQTYIKANSETVSMVGVRRLLEEDLKLDKNTLDPYKKFISDQIDKVMKSLEVSESAKKKSEKNNSYGKASKDDSSEESPRSSDGESEEVEEVKPKKRIAPKGKTKNSEGLKKRKLPENEAKTSSKKASKDDSSEEIPRSSDGESEEVEEVKPKKRIAPKGKTKNSEGLKKRKLPENEAKTSSKKRIKQPDTAAEDISDAEDDGNVSEGSHSQSSAEKPIKKKDVPTPAYGKRVEHLKSVIKSCGMSVPPSIYKKAKQAPENKREPCLIKELEEILSREGLSKNPSEKEIKDVRKRKDRARELEGIDMSNIVSSSRRRSTTSFVPPPKPKIPVESDDDDSGDGEDDSNSDDENDDDDGDDNDANDGSQSEEVDEDNDEDSD